MLTSHHRLAVHVPGHLTVPRGKMAHGVLRYSPHHVVAVIDPEQAGRMAGDLLPEARHNVPIVASVDAARDLGADVLVLGLAPLGGRIPADWFPELDRAVSLGMSLVNGLHDWLAPRYGGLANGQFVWDIRREPEGLSSATGAARKLDNRRVLMIGTDMSVGKMTAGLELFQAARERGIRTAFVATGQIGITICGSGVPLDAVRVDFAAGAIEAQVMAAADAELVIVEGQGSLLHPSSSATLPLIRGSCPTHFVLCHRAGQVALKDFTEVAIPPLPQFWRLYEDLAAVCGLYPRPKTVGISLNCRTCTDPEAREAVERIAAETGLPASDPIRHGVANLLDAILA